MSVEKSDAVVVGAGAAGLTAAYHLQKAGLSVKILEASDCIGGRLRKNDGFADFPLDMGGEWIHGRPGKILNPILDENVASRVETILHNTGWMRIWTGKRFAKLPPIPRCWDADHKWVGSTWWDFFNDNLVAALRPDTIVLSSPVVSVDYGDSHSNDDGGGSPVSTVTCASGDIYQASYVVVTVSIKLLQDNAITFVPALPKRHRKAISQYSMGNALKVFLKFSRTFYPRDFLILKDLRNYSYLRESSKNFAQRYFWDATYGQTTDCHVLGVFCYGTICERYLALCGDDGNTQPVIDDLISELDAMFGGRASECYERSVAAIWPNEPFVQTGYTRWSDEDAIGELQRPLGGGKVLFAGESIPVDRENWGFAHGAALSGKEAAAKILDLRTTGMVMTPGR